MPPWYADDGEEPLWNVTDSYINADMAFVMRENGKSWYFPYGRRLGLAFLRRESRRASVPAVKILRIIT